MNARAGEWQVLNNDTDPVPHDSYVVDRLADTYQQTGVAIRESADRLRRLADLEGWTGEAAEAFAEAAEDLHGDLSDAERRYVDAGEALRSFVEPVTEARSESWGALQDAGRAEEARQANAGDTLEGVAEPTPEQQSTQDRRAGQLESAEADLAAARTRLDNAVEVLEEAAGRAASGIRDAAEHNRDGFWDNVQGGLRDFADAIHLDKVVLVLGVVAAVVAIAALVVALVATAPFWLVALAVGLGVALLAGDVTLWANGSGDAEWWNVALDVLGLVTLGLARPLSSSANAAAASARGTAASARGATTAADEAARLAALPDGIRAANASGMAPGNNLRTWSNTTRAANAQDAAEAGTDAANALRAGVAARPGPVQSLTHLDGELAQISAEVRRLEALGLNNPALALDLRAAQQRLALATANSYTGVAGSTAVGTDTAGDLIEALQSAPPQIGAPQDDLYWRLSDYVPEPTG